MTDERDVSVLQAFTAVGGDDKACVRLFSRGGSTPGCYVLGSWAGFIAREYIRSTAVLKNWGGVDVVVVNDSIAKEVIRDCLLRRGASVEYYERPPGGGTYACVQRGSPGNITDFEATLFSFEEAEIQLMATGAIVLEKNNTSGNAGKCMISGGQGIRVGFAALNTTLRTLIYAEYLDTLQLTSLDALMAQCNLKELIYLDRSRCRISSNSNKGGGAAGVAGGSGREEESLRAVKQLCERANITYRELGHNGAAPSHDSPQKPLQPQGRREGNVTKGDFLSALEDILRVPEDRLALSNCPLASRAIEYLVSNIIDNFDATNHRAFYLKHTISSTFMKLDTAAIQALHIIHQKPEARGSLPTSVYSWLNRCVTGMGSRMMRQWLLQPLRNAEEINQRLSLVELMVEDSILRDALLSQVLRCCGDMDRLNRKLQRRSIALKDLQSILTFVNTIPRAVQVLRTHQGGRNDKLLMDEYIAPLEDINEHFSNLRILITATVDLSDENTTRINPEFDDELMELEEQRKSVVKAIESEHQRVMKVYGWTEKQLKCEYHTTYGYVFRVTRKEDQQVRTSKELITVSTSKDGVRFVSERLSSLSEQYKGIRKVYDVRQQDLKQKLVSTVVTYLPVLDDAKELIAALDVFVAWATVVRDSPHPMVRPTIRTPETEEEQEGNKSLITLLNVRHPLVELRQPVYTPNTLHLTDDANALIITGPNMGGKSTFMRSVGICVVLAQAGCFVPADSADMVTRDAVMCRVGATDHLAQGVSTFMVEMLESAAILNAATRDSLAIIDELGRGTSTYDGFGLAWAIAQEVAVKARSALLFSTHFHEMTQLAEHHTNVRNAHFGAEVNTVEGTLRFSYRLEPGPCGRSYGLYVAQLANLPEEVVQSAKCKAAGLETFEQDEGQKRDYATISSASSEITERLAYYAKCIRGLNDTKLAAGNEEASQRLRLEIQQDSLISYLL
ncbi:putative DNA mismatch repair protein MSH2 [Trypanosoma cruzi]|uniref:DNA mismatch repair protein MSH2, putative n=4 Tax=Trypanosoma cruzi TaxID=5693 RepID=Q4DZP7_TRYCC|nr:DNA mismatch repair protein MSH2, putative [Trypanosoma cruzi]EAN98026.1 DNA mismatch repair protein MSH2, putative [Trypanosoma cruzi]PWV13865.1 putative DNA mismatch repair protein MSH2 [Trypanosoma cruzi]RNC59553.1 putative DNA mismatch repair protein MSH2 [Trypanosoma cruzi]|eukprot:XP_819877.1 DNA mismatch repair protein MSH2 [Trypanosoma cruzi strain CL Brener]